MIHWGGEICPNTILNNDLHGMKFFTMFSDLGLPNAVTLQQLFNAIPSHSILLFDYSINTGQYITDAPANCTYGVGLFFKANAARSQFFFIGSNNIITHYVNTTASSYKWYIFSTQSELN